MALLVYWGEYLKRWGNARFKLLGFFPKPQGTDRGVAVNKEGIWVKEQRSHFLWRDVVRVTAEAAQTDNTDENDTVIIYVAMADRRVFSTMTGYADYEDVLEGIAATFELYGAVDAIGYMFYEDMPCATLLWKKG